MRCRRRAAAWCVAAAGLAFLAMASKQIDEPEEAKAYYKKARAWILEKRSEDARLQHFREEAAALLGLGD